MTKIVIIGAGSGFGGRLSVDIMSWKNRCSSGSIHITPDRCRKSARRRTVLSLRRML
jgi:hypothetical protein